MTSVSMRQRLVESAHAVRTDTPVGLLAYASWLGFIGSIVGLVIGMFRLGRDHSLTIVETSICLGAVTFLLMMLAGLLHRRQFLADASNAGLSPAEAELI